MVDISSGCSKCLRPPSSKLNRLTNGATERDDATQTRCKYVGSNGNSLVCTSVCYMMVQGLYESFHPFLLFPLCPCLSLSFCSPYHFQDLESTLSCLSMEGHQSAPFPRLALSALCRVIRCFMCLGAPPGGLLRGPAGQLSSLGGTHPPSRHRIQTSQPLCKHFHRASKGVSC